VKNNKVNTDKRQEEITNERKSENDSYYSVQMAVKIGVYGAHPFYYQA
jgi:hypothetical protein